MPYIWGLVDKECCWPDMKLDYSEIYWGNPY